MSELVQLIEKIVPSLEKYLFAKDKPAFLKSLPEGSNQYKIIDALVNSKYSNDLKKNLIKIGIPDYFASIFKNQKLISAFKKTSDPKETEQLLKQIKSTFPRNYNYQRPIEPIEQEEGQAQGAQQKKVSNINCKLLTQENLEKIIENKLKSSIAAINQINDYGFLYADKAYLMTLPYQTKQYLLKKNNILRHFDKKFMVEFILSIMNDRKENKLTFDLSNQVLQSLTKEMINLIYQKENSFLNQEQFFKVWLKANHEQQLLPLLRSSRTKNTINKKQEKKRALKKLYQTVSKIESYHALSFKRSVVFQSLLTDLAMENPQKQEFIEYLKDVNLISNYLSNQVRTRIHSLEKKPFYSNFSDFYFNEDSKSQADVIKSYTESLFKKEEDHAKLIDSLKPYLEEKFLNRNSCLARYAKGQIVQDAENYLSKEEIKKLEQKKQITILEKTQTNFKVDDQIKLWIKVKNVKQIKIKIYEIDLEKKNLFNNYDDFGYQNLNYLQPIESYIKVNEFKSKFEQQQYELKVDKIEKKAGAFIIDLEGQGILSRAAIRKGAIICSEKTTTAGVQLQFFDQNGKRVQNVTLWINNKKVQVKEKHIIPFGSQANNFKIVAVKGSNSQIFTVHVPKQQYNFEARFFYSHQSFIVGNKTKIIISPKLSINRKPISLKIVQNSKIQVILTDNHNVKSIINYENIKWSSSQDYVLEFPIQAYTKEISISVTGQIEGYEQKTFNLHQYHKIIIDLMQNTTDFVDIYLKKNKQEYEASILGLNGQPISSCQTFINYNYRYINSQESCQLKTDEHGKIYLGKLTNIQEISIEAKGIVRKWQLRKKFQESNCQANQLFFHEALIYRQGDKISLPFPQSIDFKNDIAFHRVTAELPIGVNCKDQLKITESGRLEIDSVKQGIYKLEIFSLNKTISLVVIKGYLWGGKLYDPENQLLYDIKHNPNKSIAIGSFKTTIKENSSQCQINLNLGENNQQNIKVHAFAYNYIKPQISMFLCSKPRGQFIQNDISQPYHFPKSEFFNNKSLSDEECYVKNRITADKFIGNNLEKPRILLKRIDVRETSTVQQQLKQQNDFERGPGGGGGGQYGLGRMRQENLKQFSMNARQKRLAINQFNSHNNFLSQSCIATPNIKGNKIIINVPKGYENLKLFVIGKYSILQRQFSISENSQETKKKDLTHGGLQNSNDKSGWTMSRQCKPVQKGQKIKINRNSQWATVALSNIVNFANIKGCKTDDWVLNWKNYSPEKKKKVYDKQYCHQLNVYIKENDPQFFEKVIKQFIKNKIVKTFVDLYLLESSQCLQWANIPKLKQLNSFEVILLIKYLIKNGQKKTAEAIARSMDLKQKSNRVSVATFNHEFDTVINAKQGQKKSNAHLFAKKKMTMQKAKEFCLQDQPRQCRMMLQCCSAPLRMMQNFNEEQFADKDDREEGQQCQQQDEYADMRNKFKPGFKPMQKTKQYTQVTYSKIIDPTDSIDLVKPSHFWAKLAMHLIQNPDQDFLSEYFLYLQKKLYFTLASCFIPNNSNADYQITNQGQNFIIQAKNSFLVFVKEVRQTPYQNKYGVMINQRFFDPNDRKIFEQDGTQLDKQVEQFLVRQVYVAQSVVTNTSGTNLELQVLLDIPEGAIPLESHQYTQIINASVNAYSTKSFERKFYFPSFGKYDFYPTNTCRGNLIIAKGAKLQKKIQVKKSKTKHSKESLSDILRTGNQTDILNYITEKNIFDENIFSPDAIYWMLGDEEYYKKVIKVLKQRKYYDRIVWTFGLKHNDKQTILEYLSNQQIDDFRFKLPIFEYFPYYSSRTHKFQDDSKSNIRNVQFKETYYQFIIVSIIQDLFNNEKQSAKAKLTMIYYLFLQDRLTQATQILNSMSQQDKNNYRIQIDYIECFTDICSGIQTSFKKARQIVNKYVNYPVQSWRKLFLQVEKTLKEYDGQDFIEEKRKVEYQTKVINNSEELKISVPPSTEVRVSFHQINLELFFSQFPYSTFNFNEPIKPKQCIIFAAGEARQQKVKRPTIYKDVFVVVQQVNNQIVKKVQSFHWVNPDLKVNVMQKQGIAKVYFKGKKLSKCYCKVYSDGNNGQKFYRDGYTDITGSFKYVLADLEGIRNFSILCMTDMGGSIVKAGMPDMTGMIQS